MTRRNFLKAAGVSLMAPAVLPRRLFAQAPPSETMLLGVIGTGRQGLGDMQELIYRGLEVGARLIAVCDIDTHRLEDAQWTAEKIYSAELGKGSYKGIDIYRDFRELLARPEIDGVLIVSPDHWHALHGIAAARAGKDIYLEKPLTYSLAEGRKLVETVRENNRILQVGSQQRSMVYFRLACEAALNQRIGRLQTIRVWLPGDQGVGDPAEMPVPKNLDYDFWLGPTPQAAFSQDRVHPQTSYERPGWLQIEQYSRGMITGWGSHMNDIAQWGNGSDDIGPLEIEAKAEFPDRGLFDVHTTFHAEALYANGVRLIMETGDPPGVRFEGDLGWVFASREEVKASDLAIIKEEPAENEIRLYRSSNHMKNCILTHIAMKLGRKLRWDPQAERFIDDDEANGRLDYPHREPWTV
jgi:predicted dehydrogenase